MYRVEVLEEGVLTAAIDEVRADGVDVDVHLLSGPDPDLCVARGNADAAARVRPGTWYVVLDTWTDDEGQELPGPYTLTVSLRPLPGGGDCAMVDEDLEMHWRGCDPAVDCFEDGGARYLRTPATGPVVMEAHLVTVDEDFDGGWPSAFHDRIERHYGVSGVASGYAMDRGEPWAPAGEGGSEFGQGSTGRPVPVLDEAWYITMYWRRRPPGGTRMIVHNPANGRAVVASAGWETGPGANTAVAGVTEEIHHHLGTGHRESLTVGFAAAADLPLGPIDCDQPR